MEWTILLAPLERIHPYLDPGTGSLLLQLLLGGILGLLLAVKIFWRRIVRIFRKQPPEDDSGDMDE